MKKTILTLVLVLTAFTALAAVSTPTAQGTDAKSRIYYFVHTYGYRTYYRLRWFTTPACMWRRCITAIRCTRITTGITSTPTGRSSFFRDTPPRRRPRSSDRGRLCFWAKLTGGRCGGFLNVSLRHGQDESRPAVQIDGVVGLHGLGVALYRFPGVGVRLEARGVAALNLTAILWPVLKTRAVDQRSTFMG